MELKFVLQELLSGCGCVGVAQVAFLLMECGQKKWYILNNFPGHPGKYEESRKKQLEVNSFTKFLQTEIESAIPPKYIFASFLYIKNIKCKRR